MGSGTAGIAVNPVANRIYATEGSRLTVIDGKTNTILNTIDLPSVAIGNGVAVNPATNLVYVAAIDQSVAVVDGNTGRIVASTAAIASSAPCIAVDDALGRVYLPTPDGISILAIGPNSFNQPVPHDGRYFPQTGYRIDHDAIWDYFNRRGGLATFGYPVSRTFLFQGFPIQIFQRRVVQLDANGRARLLNILDPGLMPYTSFNGATFPSSDPGLVASAPNPTDAAAILAFVKSNAPDRFDDRPVNFYQKFLGTVSYQTAFPSGGDRGLLPGLDLEMWGVPTSPPMVDPNNHNFVYLRFQRGIMHYDATCNCTQGILLADYLKAIPTGEGLPADLDQEARSDSFYRRYDPTALGWVRDPSRLTATDLTNAFIPDPGPPVASGTWRALVQGDLPPPGYSGLLTPGRLAIPNDLTVDGSGNIYVADSAFGCVSQLSPAGKAAVMLGEPGDGPIRLRPQSVAVDAVGNLYVLDASNHQILKRTR